MAQYLLRDGSQVTVALDPSAFDVLSYERPSGQEVYAVLSVKAERAILKSVNFEPPKNAGYLDIKMVPERSNAVKVIVLFDVGGSMDPYIKICEELFSAIKTEFKHLEYFYFHNSIYESVWKDNRRRSQERFLVQDIINKYSSDYKIIVVGDATMAPYEITNSGGSIEHWNEEPSVTWINRLSEHFNNMAWLNPVPDDHWDYSSSVCILKDLFDDRMYPLTLKGLENAMGELTK